MNTLAASTAYAFTSIEDRVVGARAKLHIGIAGPISTESVALFLNTDGDALPKGYSGAPLMGTLIGALLDRGHRVSAYTTSSDLSTDLQQPVVAEGKRFKIYYCPTRKHSVRMNGWKFGRIIDFFSLERRYLIQAIRMDKPDIVHAHWAYEFGLAAIASELPHLVTCHDVPQKILKYMPGVYRFGRLLMARKAMRTAKRLTTVSPYMRDALLSLLNRDIEVIPNPLPLLITERPFDAARPFSNEAPVIAMISNGWDKRKNPEAGMHGFKKLLVRMPAARLRLFGSGFGPGGIAQAWAQLNGVAAGMEFVGALPYAKLIEELSSADVFLHPSLEESFGMVVAEAMALGVPVVGGAGCGAVPWLIAEGGLLVDVTDPDAIATALDNILSDHGYWRRLRSIAHETTVSRFSSEAVATSYERAYYEEIALFKSCN